jgi:ribonuclease HI
VEPPYEPSTDVFALPLSAAAPASRDEVRPGVYLCYDAAGRLVGLEVHEASERLPPTLTSRAPAAPSPAPPSAAPAGAAVVVFSDGACLGNPGRGGWAVRLRHVDGRLEEAGGGVDHTTNNRMELVAAIEGLQRVPAGTGVTVVTDSQYLRRGITEWIHQWKRRGWLTVGNKPVLNQDLWQQLDELCRGRRVAWRYTPGHAGDADNERCDELAQAFARGQSPQLLQG